MSVPQSPIRDTADRVAMDSLQQLGILETNPGAIWATGHRAHPRGRPVVSENPSTGEAIASVLPASRDDYERMVSASTEAWLRWHMFPAPAR